LWKHGPKCTEKNWWKTGGCCNKGGGRNRLRRCNKTRMKHPFSKVKSFAIVGPYTLRVGFDDGLLRTIDFSPVLHGELYGPLRDLRLFEQVMLDTEVHTLVWPNGADFDPATLHDWPSSSSEVTSAVEHWGQQNETASKAD
jgi:hypothetical protein